MKPRPLRLLLRDRRCSRNSRARARRLEPPRAPAKEGAEEARLLNEVAQLGIDLVVRRAVKIRRTVRRLMQERTALFVEAARGVRVSLPARLMTRGDRRVAPRDARVQLVQRGIVVGRVVLRDRGVVLAEIGVVLVHSLVVRLARCDETV